MDHKKLIEDLNNLPEPRKTYLEIMKAHKSEVHIANILAFFFNSNEKHGLGNLFFKALMETQCYELDNAETESLGDLISTCKSKNNFLEDSKITAKAEEPTKEASVKNKRIDLLIESEQTVVCVEFKINHLLNNPLEIYQEHIKNSDTKANKAKSKELFFIVLTPYRKKPEANVKKLVEEGKNQFKQIILSHFIKKVVQNLPENYFIQNMDNIYTTYFVDFVQTIQNREIYYKRYLLLQGLTELLLMPKIGELNWQNGGYILIKQSDSNLKIRIKDKHWRIERWTKDNKLESIINEIPLTVSNTYETIASAVNQHLNAG